MDHPSSDPGSQLYNGRFTDGDQSQGIAASVDKAAHMNAVYDEIINAIAGLGLTPSEGNVSQLLQAINVAAPKTQITYHYVDITDPDPVPGWLLCNGLNGTPNLTDRFVMGAGDTYPVGYAGGAATKTTAAVGAVTPTITVNNHTLTEAEMPTHDHDLEHYNAKTINDAGGNLQIVSSNATVISTTETAGGSSGHSHTATSSAVPAHSHTVNVLPPFMALAPFIRADYVAEIILNGGL